MSKFIKILKMFYTYILQSVNFGTYYIGSTGNTEERVKNHNSGLVKSTKHKRPWQLVYKESFLSLSEARKRELYLKSLKKRKAIEKIIKHF